MLNQTANYKRKRDLTITKAACLCNIGPNSVAGRIVVKQQDAPCESGREGTFASHSCTVQQSLESIEGPVIQPSIFNTVSKRGS